MSEQVVSVAILEALPGKEEELVAMLREFYTMMHSKGYCTDTLYRDGEPAGAVLPPAPLEIGRDAQRSAG